MPRIAASASTVIDATSRAVYSILADYRRGHPQILPRRHFVALDVERGGFGAGTAVRVVMRVMGRTRTFRLEVSEPEPGRVLVETDVERGVETRFTVDPLDGERSLVTISTEWTRRGLAGVFEMLLAPRVLRRIFAEELRGLARVALEPPRT